ncbi:hypothetical protein AA11825_1116 [Acetobacter pomorum DSM 11825]|nr:hypothetical protein AA11825_1116 [Acetobacter pomorum DSM 11825]
MYEASADPVGTNFPLTITPEQPDTDNAAAIMKDEKAGRQAMLRNLLIISLEPADF